MKRHSKDCYKVHKHMKKCSSSLVIRKMQIKTTLRYHLAPLIIKKSDETTNAVKDVEK